MPTELVLLSDVQATGEIVAAAASDMLGAGTVLQFRDSEITQVIDADGTSLLTVFRAKPVLDPAEALRTAIDAPLWFGLWAEMTIPFGDPTRGRALAEHIATTVGGVVRERA